MRSKGQYSGGPIFKATIVIRTSSINWFWICLSFGHILPISGEKNSISWSKITEISRLNSGIKNRNNFFAWVIFLIQKVGTNSVIYANSGDIKILVQFPGNSILKILQNFWKCVGGVYMRGYLILKITQSVQLFTLINFIYKIRGIHLISCQPTQFQPP